MIGNKRFSLLYPRGKEAVFKKLEDCAFHDLGLDVICKEVTPEQKEQSVIADILSHLSADPDITNYRQEVFEDLKNLADVRKKLEELFEKIHGIVIVHSDDIRHNDRLLFRRRCCRFCLFGRL